MSDGTWDYVYTHDEEKYNSLIKQREELLTEYKRKDIVKAKKMKLKHLKMQLEKKFNVKKMRLKRLERTMNKNR